MWKALEYLLGIIHKRTPTRGESKRKELQRLEKELEMAFKRNDNYTIDVTRKRLYQLREEIRNADL